MADLKASAVLDPARDSALLLQRMGFFALGVALPVAAMVSRRAAVVLVPVGIILLVIAASLSEPERFVRALKRRFTKATTLSLALLLGWIVLSGLWAPQGVFSMDRVSNMLFALVIGLLGMAALGERMRATNLNAMAVGAGMATVVAATTHVTGFGLGDAEDDVTVLVRGLSLVIILTGPLAAWLLLRGRTRGALALVGAVILCSFLVRDTTLLFALLAGAAAFAMVIVMPGRGGTIVALGCAALVMLAPLAAMLAPWLLRPLLGAGHAAVAGLDTWNSAILLAPVKLLTGHGFGTANIDGARPGLVLPSSLLAVIWHELGLVGAAAFATALYLALRATKALSPVLQAGALAAYVVAFTCGLMGLAGFKAWWLMTLVAVVILTSALVRGQARTDRPLARIVTAAEGKDAENGRQGRPTIPVVGTHKD